MRLVALERTLARRASLGDGRFCDPPFDAGDSVPSAETRNPSGIAQHVWLGDGNAPRHAWVGQEGGPSYIRASVVDRAGRPYPGIRVASDFPPGAPSGETDSDGVAVLKLPAAITTRVVITAYMPDGARSFETRTVERPADMEPLVFQSTERRPEPVLDKVEIGGGAVGIVLFGLGLVTGTPTLNWIGGGFLVATGFHTASRHLL